MHEKFLRRVKKVLKEDVFALLDRIIAAEDLAHVRP